MQWLVETLKAPVDGQVEGEQCGQGEHQVHDEIHPVDVDLQREYGKSFDVHFGNGFGRKIAQGAQHTTHCHH